MWHYIVMAMGWIIKTIYELVKNYGVAIILFTLIIKLILLPLNVKSQKAMKKQQKIQPLVAELQKKYANDQAKLQQEMQKIYKENGVSMAGGCLPLFIQMPILIALYQAIQKPLTYMFNVPYKNIPEDIINKINDLKEAMIASGADLGNLANYDAQQLMQQSQIQISNWAHQIYGATHEWYINFNFLGLDLSKTPWTAFNCFGDIKGNLPVISLLIIPIFAVLSSFAQSKISMAQSGQSNAANDQAQSMSKTMTWMMPVMTGYFTLILPAGIGLYWIISGAVQIVQQLLLNKYFEDKKGEDFVVKVPESKHRHGNKSKKRR